MIRVRIYALIAVIVFILSGCGTVDTVKDVPQTEVTSTRTPEPTPSTVKETAVPSVQKEEKVLIINTTPAKYSYDDLKKDIFLLQQKYSEKMAVVNVCDTYDERTVYDIVVGDLNSKNHVLIMGAMHAREYITAQIVMRQLCDYLALDKAESYNDKTVKELTDDTAVHFIPMVNPDGVSISQSGANCLKTEKARNTVESIAKSNGFTNYEQWKANAEGTDINRNFDADWEQYDDNIGMPAPDHYKGSAPGSTSEAAGLMKLTQKYNFKRTVSYHTKGSLIYWYFKQSGQLLDESRTFAQSISQCTGYYLEDDYTSVDAAGYKDWAVLKMQIPSITIEVGAEAADNPVPVSFMDSIWRKNKNVVLQTLYNVKTAVR